MKIKLRHTAGPLQVLAAATFITCPIAIAQAQEDSMAPPNPPPSIAAQIAAQTASPVTEDSALSEEKSLQIGVTFEAKRQALPEVLAALQKQSGIVLSVAPDSPLAAKLLTARAKDLTLAAVMNSLSGLYGAMWEKQGDAFVLKSQQNILDSVMWKLPSTQSNTTLNAIDNPLDWRDEIANIGVQQLQQKNGVSFTEVSPEIAQALRAQLEPQDVTELAIAVDKARLFRLENSRVEISNASTLDTATLLLTFLTEYGTRAGQQLVTVKPDVPQPDKK